jgi:type II secretory pathway pseudopilin PulG
MQFRRPAKRPPQQMQPRHLAGTPGNANSQAGYIMLIFLLLLAMMAIAMTAAAPRLAQQIKRDNETEMIHRGTEYARAIKKFYKKFGRYPGRIEDLEKTNNIRFLRKRYTDPMNANGPWRLVRFGEIQLSGSAPGVPAQQLATASQTPGQSGLFNLNIGGASGSGTAASAGAAALGALAGGATATPATTAGGATNPASSGTTAGTTAATSSSSSSQAPSGQTTAGSSGSLFSNPATTAQPGGGAIIGVASLSKQKGIHEFNKKTDIKDWLFVYDPAQDRGQLLRGPYDPQAYFGQFSAQGSIGKPIGQPIGTPAGGATQPGATAGAPATGAPAMGMGQPGINPMPGALNPPAQ